MQECIPVGCVLTTLLVTTSQYWGSSYRGFSVSTQGESWSPSRRKGLGVPPGGSQFPSRGIVVSLQAGSWLNFRGSQFPSGGFQSPSSRDLGLPPGGLSLPPRAGSWSPSSGEQGLGLPAANLSLPLRPKRDPVNKMTHASANITFQQVCSRALIKLVESCEDEHLRKTHHIYQTRSSQMVSQEIIGMPNHSRVFNVLPSVIFQICGQRLPFKVGAFLNFFS